ncbi:MAG: FKBP-type peptidyl-prolyl cis-trans isomerase [Phycisphaerae bacterium]|nr:FKBP-type peptidyl-prolyl cis-trans isomerase [Phycisphaerae bacterium]
MRKLILVFVAATLLSSSGALGAGSTKPAATQKPAALSAQTTSQPALKNDDERLSYAVGLYFGQGIKGQKLDLNLAEFSKAFRDQTAGKKTEMTVEEAVQVELEYRKKVMEQARALQAKMQAEGGQSATNPTTRPEFPGVDLSPEELNRLSYSAGIKMAEAVKRGEMKLDFDIFLRALKDIKADKPSVSEGEVQQCMMLFQREMAARKKAGQAEGKGNKEQSDAFLAENRKKEGVVVLPSGLQYTILKEGTGPKPKLTDSVKVHLRCSLVSGKEFDNTFEGEPLTVPVNGVMEGLTEALQLMKVGAKWKLFVPPQLAYGIYGAEPFVGPNSALIIEVELLGIGKPTTQPKS